MPESASSIDDTHDPERQSWVEEANGHHAFPIQNLPIGIFATRSSPPRGGIAIGRSVLDLKAAVDLGLVAMDKTTQAACAQDGTLNSFFAVPPAERRAFRAVLCDLLDARTPLGERARGHAAEILRPMSSCTMHLPARIGAFTDFYAGIFHATNAGRIFRPDEPLLPNYKHLPIGYNGRASSVRQSGTDVVRPSGQIRTSGGDIVFAPTGKLDFELELGVWVGQGNALGQPVPIEEAAEHIAGYCLLNDWSARDIQAWEYRPLGPFLSKSFHTTVSPWVVMPEALAPYRRRAFLRAQGDPSPPPHLLSGNDQAAGGLDCTMTVGLATRLMREKGHPPAVLSTTNSIHLYWTPAQMIAHHTCSGCNLESGDLIGTGTISGPARESSGSLLELTSDGAVPLRLTSGEERAYLVDGDEVLLDARCSRPGFAGIGFGECRGMVIGKKDG